MPDHAAVAPHPRQPLCPLPAHRPPFACQNNLLPSGEAVCSVPNALVALCLNTFGLQRVRETQVLQALILVFSSRRYMRAVAGDAPRVLGSGLEELFRCAGGAGRRGRARSCPHLTSLEPAPAAVPVPPPSACC
jgi:hypothetical protein